MKFAILIAATAATLMTGSTFAADSGERTSMPNNCSDRSANCVIQDGPPRRRGGEATTTTPSSGSSSTTSSTAGSSKSGDSKSGTSGSSR